MHTCTTPDVSVTLYYMHKKALLAYDTSSHKKDKDAEQYHVKVPEYQAPDISYQKKPPDVLRSSNSKFRKCRNIPDTQMLNSNVTVDDLSLSFPLSEAVNFMEMGKHSTYHLHSKYVNDHCLSLYHGHKVWIFILIL